MSQFSTNPARRPVELIVAESSTCLGSKLKTCANARFPCRGAKLLGVQLNQTDLNRGGIREVGHHDLEIPRTGRHVERAPPVVPENPRGSLRYRRGLVPGRRQLPRSHPERGDRVGDGTLVRKGWGLHFEDYPILITVRDLQRDLNAELSTALTTCLTFDSVGGYDVLLVFDLQRLVWRNGGEHGRFTT